MQTFDPLRSDAAPPTASIAELMSPRSVAVIGASEDQGKFGGRVLHMLMRHRFAGAIYPINPHRDRLLGLQAYPSVDDTPTVPDLAIMAVPQPQVKAHVERCAERGVRVAIIITARFSDADEAGALLEREIVAVARRAGMRLVGPNCLGLISPANRLVLCSSPALDVDTLPLGSVGFVTQSGALMGTVFDRAPATAVGFSHCVSVGNQADLELCDFVEFMIDDPHTRVICTYIEGLKSAGRFVALARKAREAGKPWLAVKAGRTAEGASAAFSHTASLAGDDAVMRAVCARENVVLLDDVFAMLLLAASMAKHPAHGVGHVVLLSTSGGGAALAADRLCDAGIRLTKFAEPAREALAQLYVPGQADNPVDLFGAKVADVADFGYQSARRAMADPAADACLSLITTAPRLAGLVADIARGADECGKPVIHVMQPGRLADEARRTLEASGHPYTDSIHEAVEAMRGWCAWSGYVEPVEPVAWPTVDFEAPARAGTLGEAQAKALLARAGLPVNEGIVVADIAEACTRASGLRFPLVAKVVSTQIVHKSDVGGVALNLGSVGELDAALTAMAARIERERPGARIDGFLLQTMETGSVELLLGARRDAQFGPMVVVGSGGVLVELMSDVVLLPAPVTPLEAERALGGLRIAPLLRGYRGAAAVDIAGAVDAIVRMGLIAARLADRDFEIEVNPMKLGPAGCVAVDARARFGDIEHDGKVVT